MDNGVHVPDNGIHRVAVGIHRVAVGIHRVAVGFHVVDIGNPTLAVGDLMPNFANSMLAVGNSLFAVANSKPDFGKPKLSRPLSVILSAVRHERSRRIHEVKAVAYVRGERYVVDSSTSFVPHCAQNDRERAGQLRFANSTANIADFKAPRADFKAPRADFKAPRADFNRAAMRGPTRG